MLLGHHRNMEWMLFVSKKRKKPMICQNCMFRNSHLWDLLISRPCGFLDLFLINISDKCFMSTLLQNGSHFFNLDQSRNLDKSRSITIETTFSIKIIRQIKRKAKS